MLEAVRLAAILAAAVLTGCAPAPPPVTPPPERDATQQNGYGESVARLAAMDSQAGTLLDHGQSDRASAVITAAQPLANRLLAAPRPTLEAMQAASDLDDLYGRMLLANHNYGWARMTFQKNLVRWKNWKPQTEDTARRLKRAAAALAECDRLLAE